MTANPNAVNIVVAMIALARSLRRHGCDELQGYPVARPVPADLKCFRNKQVVGLRA
jgi:EAL domain-containing protein (putative c-di-GMP-specific phosphodiesterase class I)